MAKYIVIKSFSDLEDKSHIYREGDTFPRRGVKASEERIQSLASEGNKRGEILIEAIGGEDPDNNEETKEPEFTLENLDAESIKEQYTNDEIKARLDELEIEYKSNDNKDKLIERLQGKEGDE